MSIRRANPRKQGDIGLGAAIRWFTANGYAVAIPLADNQPYDLVADDGERLLRVPVKTTTARSPYGNFIVSLRTNGGNQSFQTTNYLTPLPATCCLFSPTTMTSTSSHPAM